MEHYVVTSLIVILINVIALVKAKTLANGSFKVLYIVVTLCCLGYIFSDPFALSKIAFLPLSLSSDILLNSIGDIIVTVGEDMKHILPITLSMYVISSLVGIKGVTSNVEN